VERLVSAELCEEPYEPAIRELLLRESAERFRVADISGLPWIEIDTPEDLRRAREEIFPAIDP
jgi:choline kinase